MSYKSDTFEKELSYINNVKIREFTKKCLEAAPDYFFTIAASSTGKYHPAFALGESGLVRHTKAAVLFAQSLLELDFYHKVAEKHDEIIAALILHDSVKKGRNGSAFTVDKHPIFASELVRDVALENNIDDDFVNCIRGLIESHMGQWTKGILPEPKTIEQKFVHQCDFLASRKFIDVIF